MDLDFNVLAGLGTCLFTGYLAFFAWSQLKELRKQHKQKATIDLLISNNSQCLLSGTAAGLCENA